MGTARGPSVRVRPVRRSVRRRTVMRLERHREIRRLEGLLVGRGQIRGQCQLLLRVILALAGLRARRIVTGQAVQGLELFRGHYRGRRDARWRREVVRTGPDYSRRWLGMRANRRVPVRYPVRRARAVVGRGAAAVTVHGRTAEVQVRGRRQVMMMVWVMVTVVIAMVMMVAADVRRRSPRVRVGLDGGAPGDRPIGALGVSAG